MDMAAILKLCCEDLILIWPGVLCNRLKYSPHPHFQEVKQRLFQQLKHYGAGGQECLSLLYCGPDHRSKPWTPFYIVYFNISHDNFK